MGRQSVGCKTIDRVNQPALCAYRRWSRRTKDLGPAPEVLAPTSPESFSVGVRGKDAGSIDGCRQSIDSELHTGVGRLASPPSFPPMFLFDCHLCTYSRAWTPWLQVDPRRAPTTAATDHHSPRQPAAGVDWMVHGVSVCWFDGSFPRPRRGCASCDTCDACGLEHERLVASVGAAKAEEPT